MVAKPARQRLLQLLEQNTDLPHLDREVVVEEMLIALREPTSQTVDLFLQELDGEWGQTPDPSAEGDRQALKTTERRLAITYAWRRAFDLMKAGR